MTEINAVYEQVLTHFRSSVQHITKKRPQDFSRRRKLPLDRVMVLLLSFSASGREQGVGIKLSNFFLSARRSGLWPEGEPPHRSALTKARAKLPWQAFEAMHAQFVTVTYALFPEREEYLWNGLTVVAFDGSKYRLPATPAMRQEFDPDSGLAQPGTGHYPQCLVSTAYDVFRRLPVARSVCPITEGDEREQAKRLLPQLPAHGLSLYDRGYPSYEFLDFLHRQPDHRYVMRCPATSTFPAVEAFVRRGEAEALLWLTPSNEFTRHLSRAERATLAPLRLRAIRLEHPDGEVSVLLTNLLDTERFPRDQIITLYYRRWGVENQYRDEKTVYHIEEFHSRTPNGIRQELFAILIVSLIARLLTALSVSSEAIETANCILQPQLKNAMISVARDAALLVPHDPQQALLIFQELLDTLRHMKYDKPKRPRPSAPRINKRPLNKWQAHRQKKVIKLNQAA